MISNNDPFVRAVASRLQRGLLAICINDERMAGDSIRLTKGELYEIAPSGERGERAYCVNSCGWQHADHFEVIRFVRCIRPYGESSLELNKIYEVEGGYFYSSKPCNGKPWIWLKGLQAEHEGHFALAWGGFRFDRFEIVEPKEAAG